MAVTSKKVAQALYALIEEGYDAERVANAFAEYAKKRNARHLMCGALRHLELINERENERKTLKIKTPFKLSENVMKRIRDVMDVDPESKTDIHINEDLIGGFIAQYNDNVYDISIKSQLIALKQKLTENN